jgi:hypothetical protein
MARPDTLVVDGHAFSWQRLCELRRQQLEVWKVEQARQLALFELKDDRRPPSGRRLAATPRSLSRKWSERLVWVGSRSLWT